jgi:hypothetical protein
MKQKGIKGIDRGATSQAFGRVAPRPAARAAAPAVAAAPVTAAPRNTTPGGNNGP